MKITGRELIAARALTGLGQKALARMAGINPDTLNRLEQSDAAVIRAKEETIAKLLCCFGWHGVALAPGSIIHAAMQIPKSKTRLVDANRGGLAADAAGVHPASSNQVYLR